MQSEESTNAQVEAIGVAKAIEFVEQRANGKSQVRYAVPSALYRLIEPEMSEELRSRIRAHSADGEINSGEFAVVVVERTYTEGIARLRLSFYQSRDSNFVLAVQLEKRLGGWHLGNVAIEAMV